MYVSYLLYICILHAPDTHICIHTHIRINTHICSCKCVYYTRSDAECAGACTRRRWSLKGPPIYAFPNGEIIIKARSKKTLPNGGSLLGDPPVEKTPPALPHGGSLLKLLLQNAPEIFSRPLATCQLHGGLSFKRLSGMSLGLVFPGFPAEHVPGPVTETLVEFATPMSRTREGVGGGDMHICMYMYMQIF